MKIKKISLKNWSEFLTDNEMKNVIGGYGGLYLTGVRCYQGQCYCDWTWEYDDGELTHDCDLTCGSIYCESMGLPC